MTTEPKVTYKSIPNEALQMKQPQVRYSPKDYETMVTRENPMQFKSHITHRFNLKPKGKYAFIIESDGNAIGYTLTTHIWAMRT